MHLFYICPTHHVAFTFAGVATLVISSSRDINPSIAFIAADVVVITAYHAVSWSASRASTHPFDSPRSSTTWILVFHSTYT